MSQQETGEGETLVAALVGDEEIAVAHVPAPSERRRLRRRRPCSKRCAHDPGDAITHVRAGISNAVVASTRGGNLYHWETGWRRRDPAHRNHARVSGSDHGPRMGARRKHADRR